MAMYRNNENYYETKKYIINLYRVQRKSVLQLVIWASCSWHVLAQKSFHLARKKLLMNSPKKVTCPSGKSRTEFTGHIAKSTSPVLSDTTFFARWSAMKSARKQSNFISKSICDMPGFGLWGRHGGLWYCSVELFFKLYFSNFDFNVQYCAII